MRCKVNSLALLPAINLAKRVTGGYLTHTEGTDEDGRPARCFGRLTRENGRAGCICGLQAPLDTVARFLDAAPTTCADRLIISPTPAEDREP